MGSLTPHLVTRDPNAAASWYSSVLGAVETSRITLPSGQVLTIELRFGDATLAIADEFPAMGVLSPLTPGGTYGALRDPFGHRWAVDQHLREVAADEVARLAAEALSDGSQA